MAVSTCKANSCSHLRSDVRASRPSLQGGRKRCVNMERVRHRIYGITSHTVDSCLQTSFRKAPFAKRQASCSQSRSLAIREAPLASGVHI